MVKKIKIAVFISGAGTNLKNLIKFSKKTNSLFSVSLVVSNNLNSKGLQKNIKLNPKYMTFQKKITIKNY